jgi:hypothetical protein
VAAGGTVALIVGEEEALAGDWLALAVGPDPELGPSPQPVSIAAVATARIDGIALIASPSCDVSAIR